ncbi:cache domain-containing protein [Synechocystis sp. PCC 7339]|uniref:cache domain-containing protein n=1 Tax=unclassified Synechocystis TaxID=2640012 RepID=UPI001BB04F1E|nr:MULTISPECIES: cache domain-containing protein [unclassified Synechocystis]QUS61789.1 cache domain-containing protein [Synechocystis sp. PCC 7338]UAJ73986.1 cache domain-containing protein [Synechocystis sp. PCC 7339]
MQSWRRRFLSYVLLACLSCTSFTAFITYISLRQAVVQPIFEFLAQVAEAKIEQSNHWFNQLKTDFKTDLTDTQVRKNAIVLLTEGVNISPDYQQAYHHLHKRFSEKYQQRLATSLITNSGMVIFSTDPDQEGQYRPLQNTTTYFKLENIDDLTPNFYQSATNQLPMITLASPLLDQSETRVGVLTIDLNLSDLDQWISQPIKSRENVSKLVGKIDSYLVGKLSLNTNTFVSHNIHREGNQINTINNTENSTSIPTLKSDGINRALGLETGQGMYLNYEQIPVLGVYRWLPAYRFALLVEVQQAEVFHLARFRAGQLFIGGLVFTVMASLWLLLIKL